MKIDDFFRDLRLGMVLWGYCFLPCHPLSPLLVLWTWRLGDHLTTSPCRRISHLLCDLTARTNNAHVSATRGVVSVEFWTFSASLTRGRTEVQATCPSPRHMQSTRPRGWGFREVSASPSQTHAAAQPPPHNARGTDGMRMPITTAELVQITVQAHIFALMP